MGLGWTLCFEMMFYSAVALVLLGGHVRRNLLLALVPIVIVWTVRGRVSWNGMAMLANPIYLEFAAGVALALLWPRLRAMPTWLGAALASAGLAIFGAFAVLGSGRLLHVSETLGDTIAFQRVATFGTAAALIVAGALICEPVIARSRTWRMLARLGDGSYSLYLAHGLTMLALFATWRSLPSGPGPAVVIAAGVIAGAGGGLALYALVERPMQRWIRGRPDVPASARVPVPTAAF